MRPGIWVGHVDLKTRDLTASTEFMETIGLRLCFKFEEISIFELRGGTHLILQKGAPGDAEFDFMVEDIDASYTEFKDKGVKVSELSRGKIHDSFEVMEPGGNTIKLNSTHVEDHAAV